MLKIPLLSLKFRFIALKAGKLPLFKGSMLRGGFGHALLRIACLLHAHECDLRCKYSSQCAYSYIFETPDLRSHDGSENRLPRKLPHPFLFVPPREKKGVYEKGDSLEFFFILLGQAINTFPMPSTPFFRLEKRALENHRPLFIWKRFLQRI